MGKCLDSYLRIVEETKPGISRSILDTVNAVVPSHIASFSYQEHLTGLLIGEVQSGKTAQMFGIMAAAADLGFRLFVMLTTDNVYLQQQTYRRALAELDEHFCICDETDHDRFIQVRLRRPTLVILKKNTNVLRTWKDNLASAGYCLSNPLFIFDDEADAASLNNMVNRKLYSTINTHLNGIRTLANSSIYLQVTATPQSVLLQSSATGWKPSFVHYFPPGKGYIGGSFSYSEPTSFIVRPIPEAELDDLLERPDITTGLRRAINTSLLTGAAILSKKSPGVCNCLVHPSVKIDHHETIAKKIQGYVDSLPTLIQDANWIAEAREVWYDLQSTKPDLQPIDLLIQYLCDAAHHPRVVVMNSQQEMAVYSSGLNIIVGGNSLGRGVTFPVLQTVFYCRSAKVPQADTFWQHCRMFGYDRDPGLMRLFIPPSLLDLFTELHKSNISLIQQIRDSAGEGISLLYPTKVNPTRKSVIDKDGVTMVVGGTNYFPSDPCQDNAAVIDDLLRDYSDGVYTVPCELGVTLLDRCRANDLGLWGGTIIADSLRALCAGPTAPSVTLIVRRDRSVGKGTGTLLSPNDRAIGDKLNDQAVLTMYRLLGETSKGWDGQPFWVPNMKFPKGKNFYQNAE